MSKPNRPGDTAESCVWCGTVPEHEVFGLGAKALLGTRSPLALAGHGSEFRILGSNANSSSWSGPSAFSKIASERSSNGSARASSPLS